MNDTTNTGAPTTVDQEEIFVRAANRKDFRGMDEALAQGANVDAKNVRGTTQLHAAVMGRNPELVHWLVKRGANPSVTDNAGHSAIHDASRNEEPEMLRLLLTSKHVDVNVGNALGTTPLMEAAGNKRLKNLKMLLDAGADVAKRSKQGATALLISAAKHDHESVKALLAKGANPNDADTYGVTALISAALVLGRFEGEENPQVTSRKTMTALLDAGADVNKVAKSGNTALAEASRCQNRPGMVQLIDAGANPNVHSTAGVSGEMTPLMMAAAKHDVELVEKLISRKADVNYVNGKGESAILYSMMGQVDPKKPQNARDTIEALLKAGARLEMGSKVSKRSIGLAHYGVVTESEELLKVAQQQGVLEQEGESKATAIFYAVALRKAAMLKTLHGLGANFAAVNELGQNTLHLMASSPYPAQVVQAIELMRRKEDEKLKAEASALESQTKQSALEFTKMLVEFGVDINGADKKGDTPLHVALMSYGHGKVDRAYIDYLVEQGADITQRNENEESSFVRAAKLGDVELAQAWAKKLIAEGKGNEVEMLVYDAAWTAPETEAGVAQMVKVFEKLAPLGATVSYQDEDGQFPLLIAAATNQEDLVVALIELGADVSQKNHEGEVAAFHSIKENHANVTRILFEKGTNPDATRNDGESLITIAYREQRSTAVQQVVEYRPIWQAAQEEAKIARGEEPAPKKLGM